MAAGPTSLIIDVDTGVDDAFALLYACASPQARLLGVSTVAGNVSLERATRNTRAVLALAGRADLPVWPGAAAPILRAPVEARGAHGADCLGGATLPEPPPAEPAIHAVDAILAHARAAERQVTLVATGPLTNIATALMREPALPRLIERLVLMGGAYREAGNVHAGGGVQHLERPGSAGNSMAGNLLEVKILVEVGGGQGTVDFPIAQVTADK